jgi:hypothetical protein
MIKSFKDGKALSLRKSGYCAFDSDDPGFVTTGYDWKIEY